MYFQSSQELILSSIVLMLSERIAETTGFYTGKKGRVHM
jgi:hypothetical protein